MFCSNISRNIHLQIVSVCRLNSVLFHKYLKVFPRGKSTDSRSAEKFPKVLSSSLLSPSLWLGRWGSTAAQTPSVFHYQSVITKYLHLWISLAVSLFVPFYNQQNQWEQKNKDLVICWTLDPKNSLSSKPNPPISHQGRILVNYKLKSTQISSLFTAK